MDCQSHLRQIGIGVAAVLRRLERTILSPPPVRGGCQSAQVDAAESFAEIYWEDKIMPYVNPAYANEAIAKGGVQVHDEVIFRCLSDTSVGRAVPPG